MVVLVEFFMATGCPYVEKAAKLIEEISEEFGSRIELKKYDLVKPEDFRKSILEHLYIPKEFETLFRFLWKLRLMN